MLIPLAHGRDNRLPYVHCTPVRGMDRHDVNAAAREFAEFLHQNAAGCFYDALMAEFARLKREHEERMNNASGARG